MVNACVVCNPQYPGKKLAFFVITPASENVYHFDEDVLKEIRCHIVIANKEVQLRVHLVTVTGEENIEGTLVALLKIPAIKARSWVVFWAITLQIAHVPCFGITSDSKRAVG